MRFPPLVIVSYAWLAQQHPDADARQLREVLAPALEWYMSERAGLISKECHDFTRCGSTDMRIAAPFTPDGCDFLLFIDYCSLWQKPRTPEQDLAFDRALRGMDLIYAHQQTAVLRLTRLLDGYACKPYCERGWPFFETSVSQFIKPGTCNLDLGGEDTRQALERFRGQLRTPRALAEQARNARPPTRCSKRCDAVARRRLCHRTLQRRLKPRPSQTARTSTCSSSCKQRSQWRCSRTANR